MAINNSDVTNVSKVLTSKPANSTGPAATPSQLSKPNVSNIEQKASQAAASISGSGCGGNTAAKTECVKAIKEAEDVVDALECVGAMYGIPSENIIRDDTLSNISVQGDTIIAPGVSTEGREAAIIRSISAVLDYISQRVDEKLNAYQGDNIEKGIIADHIRRDANPSKGTVINRLVDPDGNEVLVYDSGLVDMANTKTAQDFVNSMRANGTIPKYDPTIVMGSATDGGYFTAEDDIMNGVTSIQPQGASDYGDSSSQPIQGGSDYSNTDTPPTQGGSNLGDSSAGAAVTTPNNVDTEVNDMSQNVNESMDILNAVSVLQNTRHLGYDIFKSQGFDFVKPVEFFIESAGGKKSKKKEITAQDIEHMKFDNTHLLKAVKYFNAARAEQDYVQGTHIDVQKLVDNPNWSKALYEIEKQFDCHLVVHYVKEENGRPNASTLMFDEASEYRQKCFISKSKGFQLSGLNVSVYIMNNFAGSSTPTDQSLFGQAITATILHEIFHNIMMVLRVYNVEFNAMMTTTMLLATNTKNAKSRRQLITNFANAIEKMGLIKFNVFEKQAYIKKLLLAVSVKESKENMELIEKMALSSNDSRMIDDYLSSVERRQQREMDKKLGNDKKSKANGMIIKSLIGLAIGVSVAGAGMTTMKLPLVVVGGLLGLGSYGYLQYGFDQKAKERRDRRAVEQDIENRRTGVTRNYEEYWCDMFAAMYRLPVTFFNISSTKFTANDMTDEQIKRLHQIELNWVNLMNDPHPPTSERLIASVRYAQKTLDSGVKLAPEVKKYLEWIVENHKRLDEVLDVDKDYSKATFDPKTATNLDQHIQNLIDKAGINLTESDLSFLFDNQFGEYIY